MEQLLADVEQWKKPILIIALSTPRIMVAFMLIPFLSSETLPGLLRNGVIISFTLLLYPILKMQLVGEELTPMEIIGLICKEAFLGLVIGYIVAQLFWIIQSIGFLIDTQRGATMAGSLVPLFGGQTSPLGVFLMQAVTVIFFVSGGIHIFLGGLYESYQTWPVLSFFPNLDIHGINFFLKQFDLLMYFTIFLAGPVVLSMFKVELVMGLIGRFVPSLNVFFLAMPIKSALAFFVLTLYLSLLMYYFADQFRYIGTQFDTLETIFK
jgi:type III secretion protein T